MPSFPAQGTNPWYTPLKEYVEVIQQSDGSLRPGAGKIEVRDEGVVLSTGVKTLDFTGDGVSVVISADGETATITITGA